MSDMQGPLEQGKVPVISALTSRAATPSDGECDEFLTALDDICLEVPTLLQEPFRAIAHAEIRDFVARFATGGNGDGWITVEERLPESRDWILVTNNLASRDALGNRSHLWLTQALYKQPDGSFAAFDTGDRKIHNITHWRAALDAARTPAARTTEEPSGQESGQ